METFNASVTGVTTSQCVKLPIGCKTVNTTTGECSLCQAGFNLNTMNKLCTRNILTSGCVVASAANASNCEICRVGLYDSMIFILNATTKQCYNMCPPRTFKNVTMLTLTSNITLSTDLLSTAPMVASCQNCSQGCDECFIGLDKMLKCAKCATGTFLTSNGTCGASCPPGTYNSSTSCLPCPMGAATCSIMNDSLKVLTCQTGFHKWV
jgi:hypothetical protein